MKILVLLTTAALALWIALSCSDKSNEVVDEPLENHVYLPEEGQVSAGARFSLPVHFANDIALSGVSVPLAFEPGYVEVESLSFVGSRVGDWLYNASYFDNDAGEIRLGAVTADVGLPPGRGTLATVFFWVYGNAPDMDLKIDTARLYPNLDLRYADTSIVGNTFVPRFTPSVIHIKAY